MENWIKLGFWLVLAVVLYGYGVNEYVNGDMVQWYYYQAKVDGYAINDKSILQATTENPVILTISRSEEINGAMAVPVKKGDRLPKGTNGVIPAKDVKDGKRVALDGDTSLKVTIPTQDKVQSGITYKDSYKHKNIETNPWSGVWNVVMVVALGFCLGMLAQAFTDVLGIKYHKIEHFEPSGAGH